MVNNQVAGDRECSFSNYFQNRREVEWPKLTPQQRAFLSSPELTRAGDLYGIEQSGSKAWLIPCDKSIHLEMITTTEADRGNGDASRLLKRVCELADSAGVTLSLMAKPKDYVIGLNQSELVAWYGRHGFKGDWNRMTRRPCC